MARTSKIGNTTRLNKIFGSGWFRRLIQMIIATATDKLNINPSYGRLLARIVSPSAINKKSRTRRYCFSRGSDDPLSNPGMPEALAGREHQSLSRRIHTHVGRLLDDVETFEVYPHGVRRIGYSAMRESIGGQQVTEFIVPMRLGNPEHRNEGGADGEN